MAELDKDQGQVPVAEEISSSSEDGTDPEVNDYFRDKVSEAEAVPPPLKVTSISYGIQGKGKEKISTPTRPASQDVRSTPSASQDVRSTPSASQGASPVPAPASSFDAGAALARARQLLSGVRVPTFGSGSSSAVPGDSVEAAKKQLVEFLHRDIGEVFHQKSAVTSAISTLMASGVSSVEGLALSQLADLDRTFINFSMAKGDLDEAKSFFSEAGDLKSSLASAVESAEQVVAMHNHSQEALNKSEAAVAELKAMLKEAIEYRRQCQQQAAEHASIFHDASFQVDELAKKYAEYDSKTIVMQTRRSEAEIRLQRAEAEWNALRTALHPAVATPAHTSTALTVISNPVLQPVVEESAEAEVDRLVREAEGDDALEVTTLGKEFNLPVLDTTPADPSVK